jgi:hypothetical protein
MTKKETLSEKQTRLKESAILWAESLYTYKLISRAIGVTEDTLKTWREEDKDFSDRLEGFRIKFLNKNMKRAKPEFLLERLAHEDFKERKETEILLPRPILGGASVQGDDSSTQGS